MCCCAVQAVEQECYASSASKTVYLGKLAHRRNEAQKYAAPADVQHWAAQRATSIPSLQPHDSQSGPQAQPSSAGEIAQPVSEAASKLLDMYAQIESALKRTPLTSEAALFVMRTLGQMQSAAVDAAMLKNTGLGHRMRSLSKVDIPQIAAAAKAVIVAWKARICD